MDTSSDSFVNIANDANIPKEDVQKYLLATSDFAKSMQTDTNHYVTKDRINDASFRQKLDLISKNILRRQNPLELVFEDISTFDAENPIVGSLLREIDIKKKQSESDFIPSQPGKEFQIQKRLDRLRGIGRTNFNDNNNNNNNINPGGGDTNLNFNPGPPPSLPHILLKMVHCHLFFLLEELVKIFHLIMYLHVLHAVHLYHHHEIILT